MTQTETYYEEQAQAFFERTASVDIDHLRLPFLAQLPPAARILDAGCGSGRDAKWFAEAGCRVAAFDASAAMVKLARKHTGLDVEQSTFLDYSSSESFDGIWACACLLHVAREELPRTLTHLCGLLRPRGLLYISFKYGEQERFDGERFFHDATPKSLTTLIDELPELNLERVWLTDSVQNPGHGWVNAWLRGRV